MKSLKRLNTKLDKDPELKSQYYQVFKEYESLGVIEEVPKDQIMTKNPVNYLQHHGVIKTTSETTKIRPVFHANFKGYNDISLNDCLLTGPSMNPEIAVIILKFRRWRVALTADITKAFLQISIQEADRDVHRFLIEGEEGVRHMRFARVAFGITCSPFLLNAVLRHHLEKYEENDVIKKLKEDFYVDNLVTGADSLEEAKEHF